MAKLTEKEKNKFKASTFGLPKERKYPMPDKSHAANAKARATEMVNKGKLSKSSEEKIDAKANKMLNKEKSKVKKVKSKVEKVKEKVDSMKGAPRKITGTVGMENENLKKKPLKKEMEPKAKKVKY